MGNHMRAVDSRLHLRSFFPQLTLAALKTRWLVSPILDLLLEWGLAMPFDEGLELFWILWVEAEHGCQRAKHVMAYMMGFMGCGVLRANFAEHLRLWAEGGVFHGLLTRLNKEFTDSATTPIQRNDPDLQVDVRKMSIDPSSSAFFFTLFCKFTGIVAKCT